MVKSFLLALALVFGGVPVPVGTSSAEVPDANYDAEVHEDTADCLRSAVVAWSG